MSNMIRHTANDRNLLIVEVEKEATRFNIIDNAFWYRYKGTNSFFKLPPGKYRIMFVAEQATEEQAILVVEVSGAFEGGATAYESYDNIGRYTDYGYTSGLKSLQSLIRANFTDTTKHHLILEIL